MKKEYIYICMEETVETTQKLMHTWMSTGYVIDIVMQQIVVREATTRTYIVTSLYRSK